MKKVSLIKGFLVILLSVVLIGTTGVFAADELDFDLDDNTSSNTSNTSNSSNTANNTNTNKNNTNTNSNKSNTNTNKIKKMGLLLTEMLMEFMELKQ